MFLDIFQTVLCYCFVCVSREDAFLLVIGFSHVVLNVCFAFFSFWYSFGVPRGTSKMCSTTCLSTLFVDLHAPLR